MVKKPSEKPLEQPEGPASGTSYSTRLEPRQRELIDKAAAIAGCSAAKFIRDAAVTRAAHVVNADGSASAPLRHLAAVVGRQLVDPSLAEIWRINHPEADNETRIEYSFSELGTSNGRRERHYQSEYLSHEGYSLGRTEPVALSKNDLNQLRTALETSGMEFVRMLLEALATRAHHSLDYRPVVNVSELLSGGDEKQS